MDQESAMLLAIVGVLFWAVIGCLIGRGIGRTFRNQPFVGGVLGFLFGAIGWLLIIGIEDKRPKCPECGGLIVNGMRRCKSCGEIL